MVGEIWGRSAASGTRAVAKIPSAAGRDELDGVGGLYSFSDFGRSNERARRQQATFGKRRPIGQARAVLRNEAKFGSREAMSSFAQWQANRRNAAKSTGPITPEGKEHSRRNAVRHGLTAETVIGALEDAEDYKTFEAAIIADYDAQSAVERELVLRLASALWRLRRATAMETGLFEIEADHLSGYGESRKLQPVSRDVVYALFRPGNPASRDRDTASTTGMAGTDLPWFDPQAAEPAADPSLHLAQCFLGLANLPNYALDRLSRYEYTLWRQVAQILFALDNLSRRKPQERRSSLLRGRATDRLGENDHRYHDD
jgi:hypothetical protein